MTDRNIRRRLKSGFEPIPRKTELVADLGREAVRRETVLIDKYRSGCTILAQFGTFAAQQSSTGDTNQIADLESLAVDLADYVCDPNWRNDQIAKDLFFAESAVHSSGGPVTSLTFQNWLKEVGDYRIIADPRKDHDWPAKIAEINTLIQDELNPDSTDASGQNPPEAAGNPLSRTISGIGRSVKTALGGKLAGPSKQTIAKLEQESAALAETVRKVNAMLALPAIEKHRNKIDTDSCNSLWDALLKHEAAVKAIIKPEYCKRLELLEGETQRIIFATTTNLAGEFEPVNINRMASEAPKTGLANAAIKIIQGVRDSAQGILEIAQVGKIMEMLPLSEVKKLFDATVEISGWDQIRQAVTDNRPEWLNFFHTVDLNNAKNVGWPKYIVSKKDPSVIFRFIPAGSGPHANPEPFYMATRETTNAQYVVFLTDPSVAARPHQLYTNRITPANNSNMVLIRWTQGQPQIEYKSGSSAYEITSGRDDYPLTWVTWDGANEYAKWLGGTLPTLSQNETARWADATTAYPWGDQISQIGDYAHVRAAPYRRAATAYNAVIQEAADKGVPPLPKDVPVGAVKDFLSGDLLDVSDAALVLTASPYDSAWPISHANKPNQWGLYDMIGNVWEWCTKDQYDATAIICGGSCLAPPQYISREPTYEFGRSVNKEGFSDVGFRVTVPAR